MTANDRFAAQLEGWLQAEGQTPAPIDLHAGAIDRARRSGQRPGWLVTARGAGFGDTARTLDLPRRRLAYALVVLALVAAVVIGAIAVGSLRTDSIKRGPNGAIAYSVADGAGLRVPDGIHLVEADGSGDRRIASGTCPRFATAQSVLAYTSTAADLIVAQLASGGLSASHSIAGIGRTDYALSPDGTRVAWFEDPPGAIFPDAEPSALLVRDVSGAEGTVIVPAGPIESNSLPTWSPDGRKIAFITIVRRAGEVDWTGSKVSVVNADGSDLRVLTTRVGAGFDPQLTWSPDGRFLAYAGMPDGSSLPADNGTLMTDIFVIGSDGAGERNLTNTPDQETEPAWSPDGSHLAYVTGAKLATVRMSGSETIGPPVLSQTFDSYAWSPDGTRLLVLTQPRHGVGRISTIDGEFRTPSLTVRTIDVQLTCAPTWQRLDP